MMWAIIVLLVIVAVELYVIGTLLAHLAARLPELKDVNEAAGRWLQDRRSQWAEAEFWKREADLDAQLAATPEAQEHARWREQAQQESLRLRIETEWGGWHIAKLVSRRGKGAGGATPECVFSAENKIYTVSGPSLESILTQTPLPLNTEYKYALDRKSPLFYLEGPENKIFVLNIIEEKLSQWWEQ